MSELVRLSGPLFDGRADRALDAYRQAAQEEVGRQGVDDVHAVLDSVLQRPTGRYERGIRTTRQRDDLSINDSGIVYGPWLEGVGSRNRTTRFKGYFTFRKVAQQLQGKAGQIAERILGQYLARMN